MIYAARDCLDEAHATVAAPLVIADEGRKRSGMQPTPSFSRIKFMARRIVLHDVTHYVAQFG